MIIDCVSDLHGNYPKLDGGDLLIVAGDLTASDLPIQYLTGFLPWIAKLDYKKKIVVAGNHDTMIHSRELPIQSVADFVYLEDSGTEFQGLKIWGSPWTEWFHGVNPHCKAFMLPSEEELAKKWALIPDDIDILVTHSPPKGILDHKRPTVEQQMANWNPLKHGMGSLSLRERTEYIDDNTAFKIKIHVCGHIHEGYGTMLRSNFLHDMCTWRVVNASHVNERYQPVNPPIRLECEVTSQQRFSSISSSQAY